ncbi:MAG: hypothetical protein WD276_01480 [Actinomycetota bacterium]
MQDPPDMAGIPPVLDEGGTAPSDQPIDDAIADLLEPGENVDVFADALVRSALHLFERCKVAVTDRRVIIMKQSWPWGYKAEGSHPRSKCSILKFKQRLDASQLLILRHDEGVTGLYFSRRWRNQAVAFRDALGPTPESER